MQNICPKCGNVLILLEGTNIYYCSAKNSKATKCDYFYIEPQKIKRYL